MNSARVAALVVLFSALLAIGCGKRKPELAITSPDPAVEPEPGPEPTPDPALLARAIAMSRFRSIGIAVDDYRIATYRYPAGIVGPGGELGLSWRVQILPYLGEDDLYKQFKLNEPWDSEHNKKLIDKMPKVYESAGKPAPPGKTHVQSSIGVSGFNYAPPPPKMGAKPQPRFPNLAAGSIAPGRVPESISDGTCNTLFAFEVAEPVEWTKPVDLTFHSTDEKDIDPPIVPRLGGPFAEGLHSIPLCGSVIFIPTTVSETNMRALITPNSGDRVEGYTSIDSRNLPQVVPGRVTADLPDAATKRKAIRNYQAIAAAVAAFQKDNKGALPGEIAGPNNAAGLSWRVQLLPHLGEGELYKQFKLDEVWDSEHNKPLIEKMPKVYESQGKPAPTGHTFLRSTHGPGGAIPPFKDRVYFTPNWKPGDSLQARNFSFLITVHFAESADAVPWTKPDEMPLEAVEFLGGGWGRATLPKLGGVFDDGFHSVMADGRVTFYGKGYPDSHLLRIFVRDFSWPSHPLSVPRLIPYSIPPQPPAK